MDYALSILEYFYDQGENLMTGGVIVVGVVIALMGVLKNINPIKSIKNTTVRKVILAWLSVFLTVVFTVVSAFLNEFKQDYFLAICIINSAGTILLYWVYENTAARNFVEWIGKSVLHRIFIKKPKTIQEAKDLNEELNVEIESLLNYAKSESLPTYKDDDLKNL